MSAERAGEFEFRGTRYIVSRMSLADRTRLAKFLRGYILREARELVDNIVAVDGPPEHINRVWAECEEARRNPLGSDFLSDAEPNIEAMWMRLRHHHTEIKRELVAEMADDRDAWQAAMEALGEADAVDDTPAEKWFEVCVFVNRLTKIEPFDPAVCWEELEAWFRDKGALVLERADAAGGA